MLANAIEEAGNVILVSSVQQRDTTLDANTFDSLRRSDDMFLSGAYRDGYANLETEAAYQDDAKTCRKFNPKDQGQRQIFIMHLQLKWLGHLIL